MTQNAKSKNCFSPIFVYLVGQLWIVVSILEFRVTYCSSSASPCTDRYDRKLGFRSSNDYANSSFV